LPSGRTVWVASFYVAGRKVKRTWPRRPPGGHDGLTRTQAEDRLRREIGQTTTVARARGDRPTIAHVSARYLRAPAKGGKPRKPSTVENVESEVRCHLAPFFGDRPLDRIDADDIAEERGVASTRRPIACCIAWPR
jgi:hypothetical protein